MTLATVESLEELFRPYKYLAKKRIRQKAAQRLSNRAASRNILQNVHTRAAEGCYASLQRDEAEK